MWAEGKEEEEEEEEEETADGTKEDQDSQAEQLYGTLPELEKEALLQTCCRLQLIHLHTRNQHRKKMRQ